MTPTRAKVLQSCQVASLCMLDLFFLRLTLPLDTGKSKDSRRKGRGLMGGSTVGRPPTRGGEWTAAKEERHQRRAASTGGNNTLIQYLNNLSRRFNHFYIDNCQGSSSG